jgi:serpin B
MQLKGSDFVFNLWSRLPKTGNVFISPLNIWLCLATAAVGARKQTRDELNVVLSLEGMEDDEVAAQISGLFSLFQNATKITIRAASKIYAEKHYSFLDAYLRLMDPIAGVQLVDFVHAAEQVRREANEWGSEQTNHMIREILPPGSVDALTRMVLLSAIYFKAEWQHQFDKAQTQRMPFHGTAGDKPVYMMHQRTHGFKVARTQSYQAVSMPYADPRFSMVAMLPIIGRSLGEFENDLSVDQLNQILDRLTPVQDVEIWMPKWKVDSGILSLTPILQAMGIREAFSDAADFTGMAEQNELRINSVVHRAVGRVDEEGSEMAAVTGAVQVASIISPPKPVQIHLDRPFIYMVVDWDSERVLFMGRQEDPEF